MKSTISEQPCVKELPFPKLMIADNTACVVLFDLSNYGMCMQAGTTNNRVGKYSKCWDMEHFKDFHGSVCLENDK